MTIASVICEYNPFHLGHKYQLDYIKEEIKADYIICIMSGDFVQRGGPAIFSKELRTKWALQNGADAVFLLPAYYSCAAADLFALGAVSFIDKMGCVDYLCFGSESGDINRIKECAAAVKSKGTIESPEIKELMKQGNSFPVARQLLFPEYKDILMEPNNVLGIEYVSSLSALHSKVQPVTLKREGQDYNDCFPDYENSFQSAMALRGLLRSNTEETAEILERQLPYDYKKAHKPVNADDFSKELSYALLTNLNNLEEYLDVSDDLANKIRKSIKDYTAFSSFPLKLKSKDLTYNRISRAMTHILLGIKETPDTLTGMLKNAEGLRLLGFKESAKPLLTEISKSSKFKIITKVPAEYDSLNEATRKMIDQDLFASTLYDMTAGIKTAEYSKKIVVI
ncbi:MAG: nucleotidyltransferase family protein [Lachnospiraceae bacterium]|nr:nucleotidyltransferase family protein [Lachnospiraceae bacterium]